MLLCLARQERLELQLNLCPAVVCSATAATISICSIQGCKSSFPHRFPSSTTCSRSSRVFLTLFHYTTTAYCYEMSDVQGNPFDLSRKDSVQSFSNHLKKCQREFGRMIRCKSQKACGRRIVDATMEWYVQRGQELKIERGRMRKAEHFRERTRERGRVRKGRGMVV